MLDTSVYQTKTSPDMMSGDPEMDLFTVVLLVKHEQMTEPYVYFAMTFADNLEDAKENATQLDGNTQLVDVLFAFKGWLPDGAIIYQKGVTE